LPEKAERHQVFALSNPGDLPPLNSRKDVPAKAFKAISFPDVFLVAKNMLS
jgi:hypothetical protein